MITYVRYIVPVLLAIGCAGCGVAGQVPASTLLGVCTVITLVGLSQISRGQARMNNDQISQVFRTLDVGAAVHDRAGRIVEHNVAALDGVVSIDQQGLVLSMNPAAERLVGRTSDELVGKNIKIIMPEPYRSAHDGFLLRFIATGKKYVVGQSREVTVERPDGTLNPIELAVSEARLDNQVIFVGVLRNLSERKHAEQVLQELGSFQRGVLDAANFSIIGTDNNGTIPLFNATAERLLGWSAEEMVGRQTPAFIHVGEEVVARAQQLTKELGRPIEPGFEPFAGRVRDLGGVDEREWTCVRGGCSTFSVLLSITALVTK